MKNIIFALGPRSSYIYSAPQRWAWRGIPKAVEDALLANAKVAEIKWASFGDSPRKYLVVVQFSKGHERWFGEDCPKALREWLTEVDRTGAEKRDWATMRVVFGPGETFFAWDAVSFRWNDLPATMEKRLQSYLSQQGWSCGPPRIVAIGCSGAWLMVTTQLVWAYDGMDDMPKAAAVLQGIDREKRRELEDLEFVVLSASRNDSWVMLYSDTHTRSNGVEDVEKFERVVLSYLDGAARNAGEPKTKPDPQENESERKRMAEEEKNRREEEKQQKEKEANKRRDEEAKNLQETYTTWNAKCEQVFQARGTVTMFPHIPASLCKCNKPGCEYRKSDTKLLACKHDVEKTLRASGNYALAWLKTKRLNWHPDRFGRFCDPDCKSELVKKSTEMYAIFEELIATMEGKSSRT